jgi:hypothetical protein
MGNTTKLAIILAVVFCFILVQSAISEKPEKPPNVKDEPIWKIFQEWSDESVNWVDAENPRFAVYDPDTPTDESDDVVLDKETGLTWAKDANLAGGKKAWFDAIYYCRNWVTLGDRKGWRLPTVEELSGLLEQSQTSIPRLPSGHPFVNVQTELGTDYYWSSTTKESATNSAWDVSFRNRSVGFDAKVNPFYYVWPVRGGNGYASGNW